MEGMKYEYMYMNVLTVCMKIRIMITIPDKCLESFGCLVEGAAKLVGMDK